MRWLPTFTKRIPSLNAPTMSALHGGINEEFNNYSKLIYFFKV